MCTSAALDTLCISLFDSHSHAPAPAPGPGDHHHHGHNHQNGHSNGHINGNGHGHGDASFASSSSSYYSDGPENGLSTALPPRLGKRPQGPSGAHPNQGLLAQQGPGGEEKDFGGGPVSPLRRGGPPRQG